MRILTVTLLAIFIMALLFTAPNTSKSGLTVEAAAYCDYAVQDCQAKKTAQLWSCLVVAGEDRTLDCAFDAQRIYNGCMTAWGCPITWIAPRSTPGDN